MDDKIFQTKIDLTLKAKEKYYKLLDEVETEYINRFGHNPSEVDDDFFIDSFHYRQGKCVTVKQLTSSAKSCTGNCFRTTNNNIK